jgi:Glycosyltransferase family 92
MKKSYLCVITKNEGIDLAEWLLYHLFLGFDKIVVYDNASSDNTLTLVEFCRQHGEIEYIYWPKPFSQIKAYSDCVKRFSKECEWMAFLDVDEFLVLPKHKYLGPFLESVANLEAIAINWRMFGSNNQKTITNLLITKTFIRRAYDDFSANRHVKSIVNTRFVDCAINPHFFRLKRKKWYSLDRYKYKNPTGDLIRWIRPGKAIDCGDASVAIIHHYFTKSEEHFMNKLNRGNADKKAKRENTFNYNDKNDVFDELILKLYQYEIDSIEKILHSF